MPTISTAREVYWVLESQVDWSVEEVWVLALDSQLKLINHKMISRGTVNQCLIHPRDIFRFVILGNACAFILAHTHPSQNPLPSPEDIKITKQIFRLSKWHQIPLLDHVILTRDGGSSIRGTQGKRIWPSHFLG